DVAPVADEQAVRDRAFRGDPGGTMGEQQPAAVFHPAVTAGVSAAGPQEAARLGIADARALKAQLDRPVSRAATGTHRRLSDVVWRRLSPDSRPAPIMGNGRRKKPDFPGLN